MPVAIIKDASRERQQSVITTLQAMAKDIRAAKISSPAIIVVGETVRYAHQNMVAGGALPACHFSETASI